MSDIIQGMWRVWNNEELHHEHTHTHTKDFTFLPELIISEIGGKLRTGICCCMQVFNISLKTQI